MRFKNARVFTEEGRFVTGGFGVENGRFQDVLSPHAEAGGVDLNGAWVIPGLVDIHCHGAMGADFSDGDGDGLVRMAGYLAQSGVTSFAPASVTLPYETLERGLLAAAAFCDRRPEGCARLMGVHMEGPFFSYEKKGAQNAAYLKLPDVPACMRLYQACGGLIRIVDAAPELVGAADLAAAMSGLCTVSAAHTNASYEQAAAFFDAGARHLTHLYNAMPPIHHRSPGVIGAASERADVTAELICDGLHVHPSAVRMAFKLFPGRICLVSDSLRCCGMPVGAYELGGQRVYVQDGAARLADGTLAGSATNLCACLQNAVRFGIPAEQAIASASILPARVIRADGMIGSITDGKYADFIVCGRDLVPKNVYLGGQRVS